MKRNKTKKVAVLCMIAAMAITTGALAACGNDNKPKQKQDLSVTVTGAQNGAVSATYSGVPIAVSYTSEQSVSYVVKYAGADGTVYEESETAPTNAGKYTVSVTYAGDENYNPYSLEVTLTIAKAENAFTVTIADYVFGGTVSEPVVTGNKGGAVSFIYEGTGETAYTASATAPSAAGTYKITATAAATENYLAGTATDEFEVTLPPRTDVPTEAPVLDSGVKVLNDCFKIVPAADTEYRVVDGEGNAASKWQTEAEFTGLKQNTTYFVEARRPATANNSASAAGEQKLEVKTMKGALLDNLDRRKDGDSAGNFIVSAEQAHSGTLSLKTFKTDGTYGYILQPEFLVEREENGKPYGGYWQNGSYSSNWIDLSGWRYLSFWIYFAKEDAESVTFGTGGYTIEVWSGSTPGTIWLGTQTFTTGSWHRVVIDMTAPTQYAKYDDLCENITKIYFSFNPIAASDIGTFYLDDIEMLADVELEEAHLTVTGEESGTVNAVYSGSPASISVTKPQGGGTLNVTYTGIDGTDYAASGTAPTNVGKYTVSISLTGNAFYTVPTKEVTLVIAKAANDFTVSMANFSFGETASEPVITGNKGGTPTVTYVGTGSTEYAESETVPTAVGTYKVKVSVAESENYLAGAAEAEFMIVSAPRTDVPTQAPALDSTALVLDDGFTLAVQDDTEYRVVNASGEEVKTWQVGASFTDLEPNTTYTVQARRPAKDGQAPSAAGEQTLQVKTAERFLLDDFEKKPAGDTSCGSFIVSSEKSHSGNNSIKTNTPDGAGYILQPDSLLSDGNGYWEEGDYTAGNKHIDISGYRYLSFYIYVDSNQESVTLPGGDTFEVYNGNNGEPGAGAFTCWRTDKTIQCGSWQRIVIDLTVNTLYWDGGVTMDSVAVHVTKLYFTQVASIGTFYLDDLVLLKGEEA